MTGHSWSPYEMLLLSQTQLAANDMELTSGFAER